MKITDPLSFAAKPPSHLRAALIYGPNRALVAETVQTLRKTYLPNGHDDFSFVVLTPEDLKTTPTRLADELSSFGFFAGKKVLHLKNAGDGILKAALDALSMPDAGHFLIIEAEELTPKSTLRAWAEKADEAASIACYALEGAALSRFVTAQFQKQNAAITSDALTILLDRLGTDLSPLNGVIAQLIDYVGGEKPVIKPEHVDAMLVDQAEQETDEVVQSLADGNLAKLDRALNNLHEAGTSMVGVLRSLQSYFYRLRGVQVAVKNGATQEDALKMLRPPIFFKAKPGFIRHLRNWPLPRLDAALNEFVALETACKKTGTPELALVQMRLIALSKAKIAA